MPFIQNTLETITRAQAGQSPVVRLDTTRKHKSIILSLAGTLTVTADGTAVGEDAPLGLIKSIDIFGASKDGSKRVVRSISATDMKFMSDFIYPNSGPSDQLAPGNFTAAAGPYPFRARIQIPMHVPGPLERNTYHPSNDFESLSLQVTWGSEADIVVGGTSSFTTVPTITVVEELVEGISSPTIWAPFYAVDQKANQQSSSFTIDSVLASLGSPAFMHSFQVRARDNGARSDSIMTDFKHVINGNNVRVEKTFLELARDASLYNATQLTGIAYHQYAQGGDMREAQDISTAQKNQFVMNIGSPTGDSTTLATVFGLEVTETGKSILGELQATGQF